MPKPKWIDAGNQAHGFIAFGNLATGFIAIGNVARGWILDASRWCPHLPRRPVDRAATPSRWTSVASAS